MSTRTRRLTTDVVVDRFAWQGRTNGDTTMSARPLVNGATTGSGPAPEVRDLTAVVAERQQALDREAFAKGHAKGEAAGHAAAAAKVDATLRRLAGTIEEISALRGAILQRAEQDLVRLAVALAERIVRREVAVDPDVMLSVARDAATRLGDQTVATIHLHPTDLEGLRHRGWTPGPGAQVVGDPAVAPGGAIVRSLLGTIDVGIDAQVREVARALLGDDAALERRPDASGNGD